MEFHRGFTNIVPMPGCVASIGNFDGVHVGHQHIVKRLQDLGRQANLPVVLVTFEPTPQEFFCPQKAPARLTRLREKLTHLQNCGVDHVVCLRFDERLSTLSPDAFINQLLLEKLNIKHLIVGEDFRFGFKRQGNVDLLRQMGRQHGFSVESLNKLDINGQAVSSTRVRAALEDADFELACQLLGRKYSIGGRVVRGAQRGRAWGIPTANIYLNRRVCPLKGVYIVKVRGPDNTLHNGVANIGTRPTVDGTQGVLEVHLFDFQQDIYGHWIDVIFLKHLREERAFSSTQALKKQIFDDIHQARDYFCRKVEGIQR